MWIKIKKIISSKNIVIIAGIFCFFFVIIAFFWYRERMAWSDTNQVKFMKKELAAHINFFTGPKSSGQKYFASRLRDALVFLKDRDTLEKPYVLAALLHTYGKSLLLQVKWLEIGFESVGIRISATMDERKRFIDLPFPQNMWDQEARDHYRETTERYFSFGSVKIGDVLILEKGSRLILPSSIISDPIFVTIYDGKGRESDSLELFVTKEARLFISEKLNTEPNSLLKEKLSEKLIKNESDLTETSSTLK